MALIDILKGSFNGNDKIIWVLVVIFLGILGTILYYFIGRNKNLNKQKLYFDNLLKLEKYNIIKFKNIINLKYFNINSFNNNINNVKNKVLLKDSFIENFLRNNFLYRSLLKVNYEKKNFLYQKLLKNNTQENILDHFNKENNLKRNELKRYKKYF